MKFSELTKPELDRIIENANFTEEEKRIFKLLTRGKTITEIAMCISTSDRTINRKIKKIKGKIERLGNG